MDQAKDLKKIMEISGTDKIVVLTNNYKISGRVLECSECSKRTFLNLTEVNLCTIDDIYPNDEPAVCDEYSSESYDWLNINFDKIVAFSFIK